MIFRAHINLFFLGGGGCFTPSCSVQALDLSLPVEADQEWHMKQNRRKQCIFQHPKYIFWLYKGDTVDDAKWLSFVEWESFCSLRRRMNITGVELKWDFYFCSWWSCISFNRPQCCPACCNTTQKCSQERQESEEESNLSKSWFNKCLFNFSSLACDLYWFKKKCISISCLKTPAETRSAAISSQPHLRLSNQS